MRCLALTKGRKRCSRKCRFIFCFQHQYPGYIILLIATNFLSAVGGLFADLMIPVSQSLINWPPDHVAKLEASLQIHRHLPMLEPLTDLTPPIPEISTEARTHASHLPEDSPPYALGLKYLALGNFELAETHLARAESSLMEQFGAVKAARARTRAYSGRVGEAISFFQDAMTAQPNNILLRREASFGLFMAGHYRSAIDTLTETFGNQPQVKAPESSLDLCSPLLLLSTYKMHIAEYAAANTDLKRCEEIVQRTGHSVPHRLTRELEYHRALFSASQGQYMTAIQELKSSLPASPAQSDSLTAATYHALGTTYNLAGKYRDARHAYSSARSILEQLRPVPVGRVGSVVLGIALSYYMQDRYNLARIELKNALEFLEEALPTSHPDLLDGRSLEARLLTAHGDYQSALSLYESILGAEAATLGKQHPGYLVMLGNRGFVHTAAHHYDLALADYEESATGLEKAIGRAHPFLFSVRHSIGLVYSLAGKQQIAKDVLIRNLDCCGSPLAINQLACANSRNSLAGVLSEQGNFQEAIKQYQAARVLYMRLLPQPNVRVANNYNDHGRLLFIMGQAQKSLILLQSAVKMYEVLLPKDHPFYATGLENLASARESLAFLSDAERRYREIVISQTMKQGATSYHVRRIKGNLANNLNLQKKFAEACAILKTLVSQSSPESDPPDHNGAIRINLGRCLSEQGRFREAEKYVTEAQEFLTDKLGHDHPLVAVAYHGRARIALLEGNLRASKSFLDRADQTLLSSPSASRIRISLLVTKGDLSFKKEDLPTASRLHAQAFEAAREHFGQDNYLTILAAKQYATTLRAQGFPQKALELEQAMRVGRLPK